MDVKSYGSLTGIRLEGDEPWVLQDAAHVAVHIMSRQVRAVEAEESTDNDKRDLNEEMLAIGAVTRRIVGRLPPEALEGSEENTCIRIRADGCVALRPPELRTVQGFLQLFADNVAETVEYYGLRLPAWKYAAYGSTARTMAAQLSVGLDSA